MTSSDLSMTSQVVYFQGVRKGRFWRPLSCLFPMCSEVIEVVSDVIILGDKHLQSHDFGGSVSCCLAIR